MRDLESEACPVPCEGTSDGRETVTSDYVNRYLDDANHDPKPFVWTANPDKIIAAVKRGRRVLDSIALSATASL